jgi:hypothetical protein
MVFLGLVTLDTGRRSMVTPKTLITLIETSPISREYSFSGIVAKPFHIRELSKAIIKVIGYKK